MADVLIAGAGPTGLTLAVDLARRGVACRIVDKEPVFATGSRGRGMQPRTLEVFDDLGLLDAVFAHGSAYPPMRAYQGSEVVWEGVMSEPTDPTPDVPYPNGWMIPQWRTAALLRERLAGFGGQVELGTELVALEQDEDGVIATLSRDGRAERARLAYVVGADGGKGAARRLLGVPFEGVTQEDFRVLVADVRVTGLDREHWHLWREPMIGLCPLGGTDSFQLTIADPERELATLADLAGYVAERTGRTDFRLDGLTWLTEWRPNTRMATRFQVGRVLLAGDAAHVHPPTGGQGLNTGVQDAYNLGWKLAAVMGGAPGSLLATYEQERLPVAAHVLGLSTRLFEQRTMTRGREERQLGLSYRGGPLAVDDRPAPGVLRAGDRAPDGPWEGKTLFDVFRGPHWTLLEFAGPAGAYDVRPGTWVLVRPDGYLGVVTENPATVDACLGHLGCARDDVVTARV
ncbi:FAD-dependent monooxygenase [Kibdelosporangium phytohabitans]|uniref:FAD-dependent monooxygenase n=1 Tax=Kibdelosporangium phytohabitans TaxID=860235 RepID=UPI000A55982F|nr:FAD-dependent monooxygenase [Kibdelosporangium phytohabitans]MBE1461146.1 2-polyprenyl-6-methoxyphenol hydroxylase-like FAD-dependent oxidoreductase [Kibdelosporangium phytohabitans]